MLKDKMFFCEYAQDKLSNAYDTYAAPGNYANLMPF
jgi:hypothetical protein